MFVLERSRLSAIVQALMLVTVATACGDTSTTTEVPSQVLAISAIASSDNQTATVGTALPAALSVKVVDQNDQPVPAAVVTWAVLSGAGTLGATSSVTDALGVATTTWVLGTTTGVQRVTASIVTGKADTLTATATAGAVQSMAIVSDPFVQVTAGAITPSLAVRAFDQYGNGVGGATVAWSSSAGVLSAGTSVTDAAGVTQNTLLTAAVPQDHMVRATMGAYTATITVRAQ